MTLWLLLLLTASLLWRVYENKKLMKEIQEIKIHIKMLGMEQLPIDTETKG